MSNNEHINDISKKIDDYLQKGYLEAFLGMNTEKVRSAKELFSVAEKAECHNTGWPIGVTLTRQELAPYPTSNGIEAVIKSSDFNAFDYWSLKKNGDFYFIRTFEEDNEQSTSKSGKKLLWLDTRIWRISELLLYCLNLGRELELDFSKKVDISIVHNLLKDRVLSCNDPMRFWIHDDFNICKTKNHRFQMSESLDYIKINFKDLIFKISSDLMYYFGQFDLDRKVCDDIVDKFLKSRV